MRSFIEKMPRKQWGWGCRGEHLCSPLQRAAPLQPAGWDQNRSTPEGIQGEEKSRLSPKIPSHPKRGGGNTHPAPNPCDPHTLPLFALLRDTAPCPATGRDSSGDPLHLHPPPSLPRPLALRSPHGVAARLHSPGAQQRRDRTGRSPDGGAEMLTRTRPKEESGL